MREDDPDTLVLHIDPVRDSFEAAWREGRPRIEDYLTSELDTDPAALLRELVLVDIHRRRQMGETPDADDYKRRFPSLEATWLAGALAGPSVNWLPSLPGYEVFRELGRGGMGVVYWAWQSGARRLVAIKMMLVGDFANPQHRARFRIEAEAVGRLQHPNIVSIYEVGEEAGRPYLSMEYVGGGSLANKLAATPLPARAAAELLETLARAMDYAHRRGIVHRDLTPANILLTADGVPKITDFGLAKLLVGGGDVRTQTGSILGTPSYMAPEQAEGRNGAIGPAADVYALGAILYEMLAGRPPFRAATPLETVQQVLAQEPVSLRRLQPKVPLDLETICLKCLSKEPSRRYATAKALANDVRRYLQGEPIQARRTSVVERAWRWCRRNPAVAGLLATVGFVFLAAVTSLALGLVLLNEEQRRTEQRRREAVAERERADANARAAAEQRTLSLETLKTVVFDIQAELKHRPAMQPFRKRMLEKAVEGLQRVARSAETAALVDHSMANAYLQLGDIFLLLGEGASKARAHYQAAERIAHELIERDPADSMGQRDLMLAYQRLGKISLELGSVKEAKNAFDQSLAIAQARSRLDFGAETQRDLARAYAWWGSAGEELGDTAGARDAHAKALEVVKKLAQDDPKGVLTKRELGAAYNRLASVLLELGDLKAARKAYLETVPIFEALAEGDPTSDLARRDLFVTYKRVGDVAAGLGDATAARTAYGKALRIGETRTGSDPANADAQRDLATAHSRLGEMSLRSGDARAAGESFAKTVAINGSVARADPANAHVQLGLSISHNLLGEAYLQQGNAQTARAEFNKSLAITTELTRADPDNSDVLRHLCVVYDNIAKLSQRLGDVSAARAAYAEALAIAKRCGQSQGASIKVQTDLAELYFDLGSLEKEALQYEGADAWYERSKAILDQLRHDGKLQDVDVVTLANNVDKAIAVCKAAPRAVEDLHFAMAQPAHLVHELLAIRSTALTRQGRPADAAESVAKLRDLDPRNPENLYQAARCYGLCLAAVRQQKREQALVQVAYAESAMESLRKAVEHGYKDLAQIKLNKDLDPLRDRDDFKALLAQLEAKGKSEQK
jgi:serine/threonine-protein kinase